MISAHLPVLQVVVPLMAAPVCVLLRNPRAAWVLAAVVTWTTFLIALGLLLRVAGQGPISYDIGDWAPPWGIEYRVDLFGALVLVIVSGVGALVMFFSRLNVEREIPADRIYLFYVMYLLSLTGLLGIAITGDAFNLFVFLEISSLSSYVLISLGRDRRALTAALRYLIMGTLGATFYVIGVGLLYMMTGTLNMADLAHRVPGLLHLRTIEAALAFLIVGISLKLALFPLHLWLPNAYAFAPTTVTVFLAATATKVSVYVIIRIIYTIFNGAPIEESTVFSDALMGLGMLSMVAAGLVAIYQNNVKRMLAYSSVSQIGYVVLGLSFGSVVGLAAGIVHLFNHAIMKAVLFMAVGCATQRVRVVSFDDLAGLGRQMPVTMGALVVGALSLIGLPLTVGFVTKWYLIQAALEARAWLAVVVVLASGLFAVIYTWRIVEAAYFRPVPPGREAVREAPLSMLIPLVLLAGACVVFGIGATWPMDLALAAARSLIGAAS